MSDVDDTEHQPAPLDHLLAQKNVKKSGPTPGIIYISRLPPGMTPQKVKHLLGSHGEVGRIYAQRKEPSVDPSKPSQQSKKHQSANFSEAWLEFLDKRIAKTVALMLNAQLIGGKKGDRWRDDVWTMRYLSGFKWEMLGEQVAYERQAHQARLRQSLSQSKTEQSEYLRNVELARVLEKRKAGKKAKHVDDGNGGSAPSDSKKFKSDMDVGSEKAKRKYKQRELAAHSKSTGETSRSNSGPSGGALQNVLDGLF